MKYVIAEAERENVAKKIEKLLKKAEKYGCAFTYTMGDPYATEVPVWEECEGARAKVDTITVEAFDLDIEAPAMVKNGENTVLAMVEHFTEGNVVHHFSEDNDPVWSSIKPHCDHCGKNHVKTVTFMVRMESGEVKQVGRTCLKDFTGIDPQGIGILNSLRDFVIDLDADNYFTRERSGGRVVNTEKAIALAMDIIRDQGYVKTGNPNSNRDVLRDCALSHVDPSEASVAETAEMVKAVSQMDLGEAYMWGLDNIKSLIACEYTKINLLGYVAYAPMAYRKYVAKMKKREEESNKVKGSEYVGTIGQRIDVDVKESVLVTSWENAYGVTFLYKFLDKDGNVFVWFASRSIDLDTCKRIKGTIKDHNEREGVKQTIITRCKVA